MQTKTLCLLLCFSVLSCTSLSVKNPTGIEIVKGGYFQLIPPAEMDTPPYVSQIVNAQYRGRTFQFIAQIELDHGTLAFVAVSPLGVPLFSMSYSDKGISSDISPLLTKMISPGSILAGYQLAYCSSQLLSNNLNGTKFSILELPGGRDIYWQDKVIIQIRYESPLGASGKVIYHHLAQNFVLTSETISMGDL